MSSWPGLKELTEQAGIPFFLSEYGTHEDARRGEWRRVESYRLVNPRPGPELNPDGFRRMGEPFEEMMSQQGFIPNQFSRSCTRSLKLETTRRFLEDWLAGKPGIPALGHGGAESMIDPVRMHRTHVSDGGRTSRDTFLERKAFVLAQPATRPAQAYSNFSIAAAPFTNPHLEGKIFGRRARLGDGGAEYVALIGLRADEQVRVTRVGSRAGNPHANRGYEGEQVYMPLADAGITREEVAEFWARQDFDLELPGDGAMSNCVYCFLKGSRNLGRVQAFMQAGDGPETNTPQDVRWWDRMEEKYGRELDQEGRRLGFFGASSGFSFRKLMELGRAPVCLEEFHSTLLPCDCTE